MILTCPRCATRYLAEDEDIGPAGRQVRCSACREEWRAFPDPDAPQTVEPEYEAAGPAKEPDDAGTEPSSLLYDPPPEPPAGPPWSPPLLEPPPEPPRPEPALVSPIGARRAKPAARPRPSAAPVIFLALALLVALLAAAWFLRDKVVQAFPAARAAYAALGVPLSPPPAPASPRPAAPAPPHE